MAYSLGNLADHAQTVGQWDEAEQYTLESDVIHRQLGNLSGIVLNYRNRIAQLFFKGDLEQVKPALPMAGAGSADGLRQSHRGAAVPT
jgi:hypothetical protein